MKKIQILGTGCPKCNQLTANAKDAAAALGIDYELEKITSINEMLTFGVMTTPGLAVEGKVVSQGKVLTAAQIAEFLR
jgi:small redox-active disulfide protein 2